MKRKSQKGFTLVEILVSMALLGIIGVCFLGALTTTSKSVLQTDSRETAKNIAELQMEAIKDQPYALSYAPKNISADYPGFSVETTDGLIYAQPIDQRTDGKIQKIEVNISWANKTIYSLTGYKTQ